jgi:hypothetical protein
MLARPAIASGLWAAESKAGGAWLDHTVLTWHIKKGFSSLHEAGVRYPVKYRLIESGDIVGDFMRARRLVICSGHFLLNMLAYRSLVERGIPICSIANLDEEALDGIDQVDVWGTDETMDVIANNSESLYRANAYVNQGKALTVYNESIDQWPGGISLALCGRTHYFYPNIFRFAEAAKAPVYFLAATPGNQNDIVVRIAPFSGLVPTGRSGVDACVEEYRAFLEQILEAG